MPFVFKRLALVMSIAAAFAADKEAPFKASPASSYPQHQTNSKVTIGVDPFTTDEKAKTAFGKVNPYHYGVLPVLVVVQNDSDQSIRLANLTVEYVGPNSVRAEATPAKDVRYVTGGGRPKVIPGPAGPIPVKGKKSPLDIWEIEGRAFAAQMLPPGQSANGFFYFQTGLQTNSTIYITGLAEASSGKELLYFEIPLK